MSRSDHADVELAQVLAEEVLGPRATEVDAENRFPRESIDALRQSGLMGWFVPRDEGGRGGDLKGYCEIAAVLGEACLPTALTWAMHGQQVAVLADHGGPQHSDVLSRVAVEGILVASVTTEYGKGGGLLTAQAALEPADGLLELRRKAPAVSGGAEAGAYLITMRTSPDRPPNDVSLVLVLPQDGDIQVAGEWKAMGMRGTRSVSMEFDVTVSPERRVGESFRQVALQTMVPVGHLGWVAAWHGAARGLVKRLVEHIRRGRGGWRAKAKSDLFRSRLARLRLSLDLVESALDGCVLELEALRRRGAEPADYEDPRLNIRLNNLKVAGSEMSFAVANDLLEMSGMFEGYLQGSSLGIERVFRDLRSAALMYHNDRLLAANGRLMLLEGSPLSGAWKGKDTKPAEELCLETP